MEITVKELEPHKLSVNYNVKGEDVLNKRSEIISVFKKGSIPGFRPGKAPAEVVNRHYKSQIDESLKRALAEDAFHNTLFEKNIRAHGAPKFNSVSLIGDRFSAEFEMYSKPNFNLVELDKVEVVKPHASTTATEMCEKMLQDLRMKFGSQTPFEEGQKVQMGDSVILDYEGFLDGQKVEPISAQGEMVTVGASSLKEFDDNLIGMTLGETKKFTMVVPKEGLPSLSGKAIDFVVTLNVGSRNEPCPLDDTLAEKVGKKDFAELRDAIAASAGIQLANKEKQDLISAISVKLVELHDFEVPNFMSESEARYLVSQSKLNWDSLKEEDKKGFAKMAEKNVKLSLILDKVREDIPDAQISDEEVFEVIKHNLAKTRISTPIDDVIKEMSRTGYLQIAFSRIKDEYALDAVQKQVKVIE